MRKGVLVLFHDTGNRHGVVPFGGVADPVRGFLGAKVAGGRGLFLGRGETLYGTVFGGALKLVTETLTEFGPENLLFANGGGYGVSGEALIPGIAQPDKCLLRQTGRVSRGQCFWITLIEVEIHYPLICMRKIGWN